MTNDTFSSFRVCAWRTVSYRAAEMAAARASVEAEHLGDAVVTSCQRLEAYGFGDCTCAAPERITGRFALERLAAVAAGLDSVVLGEDQVIGQVRAAFTSTTGNLRRAGDVAIAAARALRAETNFDSHAGHMLDKALKLSTLRPEGRLLVLGIGAMGKLIAARAAELGFDVTIAARREPESPLPWTFVELGRVPSLPRFEVIVGCLGSGAGEIAPRVLPAARLLVDLGTPRNFSVLSGPGVVAISDMLDDELQRPHAMARRNRLRKRLGVLLESRLAELSNDSRSPAGALRADVEAIRQQELRRIQKLHPGIDPQALDTITRSLLDKVLHAPTQRLKELDDPELARQLATLFATETPAGSPATSPA